MSSHMRNSNHNHNLHLHIVSKPANHPRSDVINTMQDVINSAHINVQSKNRCASAESSTTCSREYCADLNTSGPITLLKHSNQSFPLNSHNLSFNHVKLKGSRRVDVSSRPIRSTDRDDSSAKTILCTNTEAIKLSGGLHTVHDCGPIIKSGHKVQDLLVCCMCGDAGIADLLFLCSKCAQRHQHRYCSRSYPDVGEESSICNWCLHKEDSINSSVTKACGDATANKSVCATACPNVDLRCPATSLIPRDTQCQLGNRVFKDADEVMVKKAGHSKAFEYLLLIAAQSLPQENRASGNSNAEIRQHDHSPSAISTPVVGIKDNRSSDIIKANVTPLVNIVNVGPPEGKSNGMNPDNNRLIMSLNTNKNMRIHSPVKISIDHHKSMDVSRFIGGSSTPKRQRCSKGINASLKCRKKGLQLSPSRPNYRRYKLLADVVC